MFAAFSPFFFFFFFTRRHRRVSVRVGLLFFDSRLARGGEKKKTNGRCRSATNSQNVVFSFFFYFHILSCHKQMASREREGEEVEEEEEGDGENGGKRRIKEKGATAGHVSPGLPACLPHH